MKRISAVILLWFPGMMAAVSQNIVSGVVTDVSAGKNLSGASVVIKGKDGKIKKFTSSKSDGSFSLTLPSLEGRLEVSMLGFEKQCLSLDSLKFPVTVYMEPGETRLKEVTVNAERIREQGDTITYTVGSFAQSQDRSIGDVLKRMPGIDVEASGKISYQGEAINKFYIEGADMLGGKYGLVTNGINHEDVGAVEVLENHQPMQVLSGISFSDKAAINLKLKNKVKATWSFHGKAAGGYSTQPEGLLWEGEAFAMAMLPKFQNLTTVRTNNDGDHLGAYTVDFFASSRATELSRYIDVSLPGVPNLTRKRTLFNRSVLASANSLWKLGRGEVKAQIDYSFNRIAAEADNITNYFLSDRERIVREKRSGTDYAYSLSAQFIFELNQRTAFINNTLKANIDWDKVGLDVRGSLPNSQSASLPAYYGVNDFKMIKRFNGRHLVTFKSVNEWESLPQHLCVSMGGATLTQGVSDHAFHTRESVAYAFALKGITLSLEGGLKGYFRSMQSDLTGESDRADKAANSVRSNYFTLYANPKFEFWVRRVDITLEAPISFARYSFHKALADRSEFYFSPALSMTWKPNNKFSLGLRASSSRSPMDLSLIQPEIVMTNYRSFRRGVDDFYCSTSQSLSASLAYKHTRRGLFGNAFVMHGWSHLPYTLEQQLSGDYILYSYATAKSEGRRFIASADLGKTLDFMRGTVKIKGSVNRNESHLISERRSVNSIANAWSAGMNINGSPTRWLSVEYRLDFRSSRLTIDDSKESWLGNMENELMLNFTPHGKWEWHISGEHYRNEVAAGVHKNMVLVDTKVVFKPVKRLELSLVLSNILNRRTYSYTIYTQLSSFESVRRLRGREILLTISIKK
ncbi:MAG: carboxypeptidase-like regulatory domain-containing protein [Muribaculaceae bacterium]|nr:carboxypeptidase-like regulatory domain-containing protein [Muribaculaceae bacterium]